MFDFYRQFDCFTFKNFQMKTFKNIDFSRSYVDEFCIVKRSQLNLRFQSKQKKIDFVHLLKNWGKILKQSKEQIK